MTTSKNKDFLRSKKDLLRAHNEWYMKMLIMFTKKKKKKKGRNTLAVHAFNPGIWRLGVGRGRQISEFEARVLGWSVIP